jgi:nucleoside-diphosphate-sugar epimerase
MRILVTGHKGYIGTVLVPMLLQAGHEVVGYDCDWYRRCTFGEPFREILEVGRDIRDVTIHDLVGFDAVLHLAGLSNDPLGNLNPDLTFEINYKASVQLANLCKWIGIPRFIFSSSCSNYGAAGDTLIDEAAEFKPVSAYGASKVLVEQEVSRMADAKFCPVFLRNATAYGISPRLRFDLVLNNLVAWALTTGKVHIKSDGTPWRPLVHVEDIARAFVAALHAPMELVHNRAFNVGTTTENYRVSDLAKIVEETVPGCQIEFGKDAGPDARCYRVNCDRIAAALPDFRPRWNVRKGAQQLYEAYKEIGLTFEDFEGPRYQRIQHIKHLIDLGYLDDTLRWSALHSGPEYSKMEMASMSGHKAIGRDGIEENI